MSCINLIHNLCDMQYRLRIAHLPLLKKYLWFPDSSAEESPQSHFMFSNLTHRRHTHHTVVQLLWESSHSGQYTLPQVSHMRLLVDARSLSEQHKGHDLISSREDRDLRRRWPVFCFLPTALSMRWNLENSHKACSISLSVRDRFRHLGKLTVNPPREISS